MSKVTIEFPSQEMANLFVSTFTQGEFSMFINNIASEEKGYNERLEQYIQAGINYNDEQHIKIDLCDYLIED